MNRTHLSAGTLAAGLVALAFLVGSTLFPFFQNWPEPFARHFQDAYSYKVRGADLIQLQRATEGFLNHETVYHIPPGRHQQFSYPPQSLLLTLPFTLVEARTGYFLLIVTSCCGMLVLYSLLCQTLVGTTYLVSSIQFLTLVFLSYPGLYAFERGNAALLGSLLVFAAFFAMLKRKYSTAVVFLSLATCLKPIYLPYCCLIAYFPERRKQFLLYSGTAAGMCAVTALLYGSADIFIGYLDAGRFYAGFYKNMFGATNIGLLSSLAIIAEQLGFPEYTHFFMNYEASFSVLALLLAGVLGCRNWKEKADLPILFGAITYVMVLWQFMSVSYGALPILLLLPIGELTTRSLSKKSMLGFIHAVCIALVFAPPEFRPPLLRSFRGLYYICGFAVFLLMIKKSERALVVS